MFRKYLRILAYVKPYGYYAVLNVIFNFLVIVFSLVSFVMLIPFLNLLFGIEKLVEVKPELTMSPQSLLDYLNYFISQIILSKGKIDALIFICLFLLGSFFLRNMFRFLAMYFLANVRIGAIQIIRNETYKKLTYCPFRFIQTIKKGILLHASLPTFRRSIIRS